jgi:hypothetical protein
VRLSSAITSSTRTRLCVLVAASTALAGLAGGAPASAAPSGPSGSAFVWAHDPTSASYTPSSGYQWNSTSPWTAVNTVTRSGVGSYTVFLPGLAAVSGTVLVTAYGSTNDYCKVGSWGPNGTQQAVNVRCYNSAGQPADSTYTLSYSNRSWGSRGYVWADQPGSASYNPSAPYQANSSGATNRITRSGVGTYQVILPNLGASAGHVEVTAYGYGSERCKTSGWGASGTDQSIGVRCFTAAGAAVDTYFTLTYVRDGNVLGEPVCCSSDGNPTAYAWASQPTTASYTPVSNYHFPGWAASTITRVGTGDYTFKTPINLNSGNVQVTAYGGGSEHCKVMYWNSSEGIRVRCFAAAGSPVDSLFDVSFAGPFVIG